MKIVVLDGYAANPGDLSWEGMKVLGECTIYDRTAPEEVLERAAGAEAILTNKVIINADHMAALPELKYIGVLATGYNVVDTAAAKERGIVVTNIPSYSTASVAQMVFAHILNITQQVQHHSEEVHKGRWAKNKDFSDRPYRPKYPAAKDDSASQLLYPHPKVHLRSRSGQPSETHVPRHRSVPPQSLPYLSSERWQVPSSDILVY